MGVEYEAKNPLSKGFSLIGSIDEGEGYIGNSIGKSSPPMGNQFVE